MLRCPFTPVCKLTCNLQVELVQVGYLQSTCYSITSSITHYYSLSLTHSVGTLSLGSLTHYLLLLSLTHSVTTLSLGSLTHYLLSLSLTHSVTTLSLGSITHYLLSLSLTHSVRTLSLGSITHYLLTIINTFCWTFIPGLPYPLPTHYH